MKQLSRIDAQLRSRTRRVGERHRASSLLVIDPTVAVECNGRTSKVLAAGSTYILGKTRGGCG